MIATTWTFQNDSSGRTVGIGRNVLARLTDNATDDDGRIMAAAPAILRLFEHVRDRLEYFGHERNITTMSGRLGTREVILPGCKPDCCMCQIEVMLGRHVLPAHEQEATDG